jgi:hypothetical protein
MKSMEPLRTTHTPQGVFIADIGNCCKVWQLNNWTDVPVQELVTGEMGCVGAYDYMIQWFCVRQLLEFSLFHIAVGVLLA